MKLVSSTIFIFTDALKSTGAILKYGKYVKQKQRFQHKHQGSIPRKLALAATLSQNIGPKVFYELLKQIKLKENHNKLKTFFRKSM